jgi:hypothetical protein
VFLFAGLFLLISLVSYNPFDSSWNTATAAAKPLNLMGRTGAALADLLLQTFGFAAYAIPILTLLMGWSWVRSTPIHTPWAKLTGSVLLVSASCAAFGFGATWRPIADSVPAGGFIGGILADALVGSMNLTGAAMFTGVCWILGLYLVSTFEMSKLAKWFGAPTAWFGRALNKMFAGIFTGVSSGAQGAWQKWREASGRNGSQRLMVQFNGRRLSFPFAALEMIGVNGFGGDDTITMYVRKSASGNFNASLHGGDGNDVLSGDCFIWGDAGNDSIIGGATDQNLSGGAGDDTVHGGGGNDLINNDLDDSGRDQLFGDSGNDSLFAGALGDMLVGGTGDDELHGGIGRDTLRGGEGNDTLRGGWGKDYLYGGSGNDLLEGGGAADRLFGQEGDDDLDGGTDTDTLTGNGGNDDFADAAEANDSGAEDVGANGNLAF